MYISDEELYMLSEMNRIIHAICDEQKYTRL